MATSLDSRRKRNHAWALSTELKCWIIKEMRWNKNKVIIIVIIRTIRLFYLSENDLIWSDWVVISAEGYRDVFSALEANDQLITELVFTSVQTSGGVEVNEHL